MNHASTTSTKAAVPGWWLVTQKELSDLWKGGRAMLFLLLFSLLLGITSFLLATNSELKLLPPREMVFLILQITISVSLFISLLIAADSISGERERATLEGLLLVPTSRRQIVLGKFLAAMSIWPAAFLIAVAHIYILSPNEIIFGQGLFWGLFLGTLLLIGFTAFGLLVSIMTGSNRTSLFVTLFVAILFLMPTQFPGTAQTGMMGRFVKRINPIESVNQILEKIVVNNRTFDEMATWLAAPVILAILACVLLFVVIAPRLDLTGEKAKTWRPQRATMAVLLIAFAFSAMPNTAAHAQTATSEPTLQILIDVDYQEVKTGDSVDFTTTVTNQTNTTSSDLLVAMNIVNLGEGDPVDPEDWSPERTQEIEPLVAGESAELEWTINAILEGDYLAYMVVIPEPDDTQSTSVPVASPGLHLTVQQFSPLNPAGITPVAFGIPLLLSIFLGLQLWLRRRQVNKVL